MITSLASNTRLIIVLMIKTGKSWGEVRSELASIDEAIESVDAMRLKEYEEGLQ